MLKVGRWGVKHYPLYMRINNLCSVQKRKGGRISLKFAMDVVPRNNTPKVVGWNDDDTVISSSLACSCASATQPCPFNNYKTAE